MKGNLKILGLGGMGINVVNDVYNKLTAMGDKFANVEATLLDTTNATISNYPYLKDRFVKINPTKNTTKELDGLSGERKNKLIIDDIKHNIEQYVDSLSVKKNDYYVLIFSSSGGSGNIIGTVLTKELAKKDANILIITAVDSSNYLTTHNSIKTLESLDALSRTIKKPLLLSVHFNNKNNGISTPDSERDVNKNILRILGVVSMFVSGSTHDIDHQDMSNFFNVTNYKTFKIEPGLYYLDIATNKVDNNPDILLARTLLDYDKEDVVLPPHILHNKIGYADTQHVEKIGKDNFPIYLLYEKDVIAVIHNELTTILNKLKVVNTTTTLSSNTDDEDIIF